MTPAAIRRMRGRWTGLADILDDAARKLRDYAKGMPNDRNDGTGERDWCKQEVLDLAKELEGIVKGAEEK